jgi:hypothetical protein
MDGEKIEVSEFSSFDSQKIVGFAFSFDAFRHR